MSQRIFQKFSALQRLSALGVATLTSFVVDNDNYSNILCSLKQKAQADFWVLRAPPEQKHLVKRPAYARAELDSVLASIFSIQPDSKLLITELIPAIRAGIFVKAKDFVYCEYVPGALQSLARDGTTPVRVLLKVDGSVSFIEINVPEFFYVWAGASLETHPAPKIESTRSVEELMESLLRLIRPCPQLSIIEWVQAPNQKLYAIDFKHSEVEFLGEHEDIYHGLVNRHLISLPDKAADSTSGRSRDEVMFIERPLYSHVTDGSAFLTSKIIIRAGGLLAHLVVECSHRMIPCIISPVLFSWKPRGVIK